MSALQQHYITEAEYWVLEERSLIKHEYFDGKMYVRVGGSNMHARLCVHVAATLINKLRGKPCCVVGSEQRVKVEATRLQSYLDASVYCSGARFEGRNQEVLLEPKVIIEVLSPSTADYDRGAKFTHYKQIPSLTDYLLVSQSRVWVEHYLRTEAGWLRRDYNMREDVIALPSIEAELPLDELYEGLDLPVGVPTQLDIAGPNEPSEL